MHQLSFSLCIFFPALLSTLLIFMLILARKENKLLGQQLTATSVSLAQVRKELTDLEEKHEKIKNFQNNLQVAELTTKLQKPRLDSLNQGPDSSLPDKYRYFQTLAQKDMSVEEIASVLDISVHEAGQLISLSKLAGGGSAANVSS